MTRTLLVSALWLCLGTAARAADPPPLPDSSSAFVIDHWEPGILPSYDLLGLARSSVTSHLVPAVALQLGWADGLVELAKDGAARDFDAALVEHRLRADLTVALGLFDRFAIGLQLPAVITQSGSDLALLNRPGESVSGGAVGDVRLGLRGHLYHLYGFGIALGLDLYLPSGDDQAFMSFGDLRARPLLILDWHAPDGLGVIVNLGVSIVPATTAHNLVIDDGLSWGVGLDLPTPAEVLHVHAAVFGTAPFESARDPADPSRATGDEGTEPIELTAALVFGLGHFQLDLGGGAGLSRGVGASSWRAFAGLAWSPKAPVVVDADGDGLIDHEDGCPHQPEDRDGFADADGCPDDDNDGDGVLDLVDGKPDASGFGECRDVAEDRDGFQDEDGCPDADNDGDSIADQDDGAPDASGLGACRDMPEDLDGHQDDDGCPDPDNDQDGIPDVSDGPVAEGFGACRDAPETVNGYRDEDGCPDKAPKSVRVTRSRIEILEKVFFQFDKAIIKPESYPLLDEVARVLDEAPELTLIRIEGHTDARGSSAYNNRLSLERAEAVRDYLVTRGVDPQRMVASGYGKSRPLPAEPGTSRAARRALNRRVEFVIIEVNGKPHAPEEPVIIDRPAP